jgi:hypothetical protein
MPATAGIPIKVGISRSRVTSNSRIVSITRQVSNSKDADSRKDISRSRTTAIERTSATGRDTGRSRDRAGWDLAERLERLTANAKVATVLGSIPASSGTVESEGRQMKQCCIKYLKILKSPRKKRVSNTSLWCQPTAWSWILVILVPNTSKCAGKVSVKYFLLFLKNISAVFPFFSCHFWTKRPKFWLVNYRRPADKPRAQFLRAHIKFEI